MIIELPTAALLCLTQAVYFESRGEPFLGQVAVAETVLNRVDDPRWPSTVCNVVYQPYQFSFVHEVEDKYMDDITAKRKALEAVEYAVENRSLPSTHYHNLTVSPKWSRSPDMVFLIQIGHHKFYQEK